jgi:ubiquitin-conjugating enzyme E2 Q
MAEGLTEEERILGRTRKLSDVKGDTATSPSAWKVLRWLVANNRSYISQVEDEDELVQGIPTSYRQFRLVVGSPEKEHELKQHIASAQATNSNAIRYPTLYAFHGSAVSNWNNILQEGLHFSKTTNGRAYGHGVYFAKQGEISLGTYATATSHRWKNADFGVAKLAALCEIVNLPDQFVSMYVVY